LAKVIKYGLEIKVPKEDKQRIDILENITLGSSDRSDIVIEAEGVSPLHLKFKIEDEVLTVTNLGGAGNTKVGRHALGQGKTYILDKGDKITIGKTTLLVTTEKVEEEEFEVQEEQEELIEDEGTEEAIPVAALEDSDNEVAEEVDQEEEEGEAEEYEEEEEAEFEEEKTSTFVRIRRILDRKSRSTPQSQSKFKKSKNNYPPIPGFAFRILSILINAFILFGIFFYVLPLYPIDKEIQPVLDFILSKKELLLSLIPPEIMPKIPATVLVVIFEPLYLKIALAYMALELAFHFLLGTSLPLFLAGVKEFSSNMFVARIKAVIRCVLGFITWPFLIFDLPLLINKRTFKEVLTFSHLHYRGPAFKYISLFIFYPAIILSVILFPLLPIAEDLIVKRTVTETKYIVKPELNSEDEFVRTIINKSFSIKTKFELKPGLYVIPSIAAGYPQMTFMDNDGKRTVKMKISKGIDLNPEFKKIPENDFYFAKSSPKLNLFLKQEKAEEGFEDEINSIIVDTLSLSLLSVHQFILNHGPFFKPYLPIREKLFEKLGRPASSQIIYRNREKILKIESREQVIKTNYYLPLIGLVIPIVEIEFNKNSEVLASKIITLYEDSSPVKPSMVPSFNDVDEWNGFLILDMLTTMLDKSKPLPKALAKETYKYFFSMIKKSNESKESKMDRTLIKTFKEIDLAIKAAIKARGENRQLSDFNYSMNRLQKALEDKDQAFFQMNAP